MAQRTKQTARKSTGGWAPRRQLAAEGAASRAAASHAVGSGGPKPWRGPQPSVDCAAQKPLFAEGRSAAAGGVLTPEERIVAEAPPRVPVERGAVAELDGRWGKVVDVDADAGKARMCWVDGPTTTVKMDQLRAVKSLPVTDWSSIGGTMRMADAKSKYLLTDKDAQKLPRTLVGSDVRGGSNVQVVEVLAAALQKHGAHIFVKLLAWREARQEAENARLRQEDGRLRQEIERSRGVGGVERHDVWSWHRCRKQRWLWKRSSCLTTR